MDTMTSPMHSNSATEILTTVYNNLKEPIERYYLCNKTYNNLTNNDKSFT